MPSLQQPVNPATFSQAAILILLETIEIKNVKIIEYERIKKAGFSV